MKIYDKQKNLITVLDLGREIARGGEGMIIDNGPQVVKLYLPGIKAITEIKFNDLTALSSNIFIKPEKLVYDINEKILGYLMNKVPSDHFPILSLFNKAFCTRENITDKVKINIAEKLIDAMNFAHSKNIVIGDYNPYNILVNDSGSVYLIDVDSYETPNCKHSGLLFDEIRDYLYNGIVSIKADYFSLSIIVFNLLTFVHPFKGINKRVPKLSERMIKKLPIIKADPDLSIPKCYSPLSDRNLLDQFEKLYINGDRFVLQPNMVVTTQTVKQQVVIKTDQLIMKEVVKGRITKTVSSKTRLIVTVDDITVIYDVSSKGTFKVLHSFRSLIKDLVFVSNEEVFLLRNSILFHASSDYKTHSIVKDFTAMGHLKTAQYGSILIVVSGNMIYKIFMNEIFNNIVRMESHNVFGGKFVNIDGMFQRVGEYSVLFYEKKGLNNIVLKRSIKNLVQFGNTGILEYYENDKIFYKLFSINNLVLEEFACPFDGLRYYDVLNDSVIVVPQDDKLSLIRIADMSVSLELQCGEVSENSIIRCCNAGIIISNPDGVYLTNKK
jgi:serine/threonine protein kinase